MRRPETLRERFWRAVALFAWRRWVRPGGPTPVGIPGQRDPEHACPGYSPRTPEFGERGDCDADGHYLCAGCSRLNLESEYAWANDLVPPTLRAEIEADDRGSCVP